MVLLTLTEAGRAAVTEYYSDCGKDDGKGGQANPNLQKLEVGSPIDHANLIELSKSLVSRARKGYDQYGTDSWRLDKLLRGTSIYTPPPPPKPEPSAEYKALMQRLRKEEEQREYDRMTSSQPGLDILSKQLSFAASKPFNPMLSHGRNDKVDLDEATYQNIDRQLTLIINVLVTVIASGITIWFAARYWAAPQRIAISLLGALVIAIAEVGVYTGYIRRIQDAKIKERKMIEKKSVTETWTTGQSSSRTLPNESESIRHRKGKHR